MSRLGEYTVDGGIYFTIGNTSTNYTFDTNAYTALGNADFVIASIVNGTTAATLQFNTKNVTLLASGAGTVTLGEATWTLQVGRYAVLPKSVFVETTGVTGKAIASTASTLLFFQFCSWV